MPVVANASVLSVVPKRPKNGAMLAEPVMCIEGGKLFQVLNVISLHGGLASSWVMSRMTVENTVQKMIEHWTAFGLRKQGNATKEPETERSAVPG